MNNSEIHFRSLDQGPFKTYWLIRDSQLVESAPVTKFEINTTVSGTNLYELHEADRQSLSPWLYFGPITNDPIRKKRPPIAALHRRFAAVSLNPDAIFEFAQKYGALGVRRYTVGHRPSFKEPFWESVIDWYEQIHIARILISAMELFKSEYVEEQKSRLLILEKHMEAARVHISPYFFTTGARRMEFLIENWQAAYRELPIDMAAREFLEFELNWGLADWCKPEVRLDEPPAIELRSFTVLGAIYGELAQECTRNCGLPRQCAGCGNWYTPEHGRSRHCSESCKTKAYRLRKQRKEETYG